MESEAESQRQRVRDRVSEFDLWYRVVQVMPADFVMRTSGIVVTSAGPRHDVSTFAAIPATACFVRPLAASISFCSDSDSIHSFKGESISDKCKSIDRERDQITESLTTALSNLRQTRASVGADEDGNTPFRLFMQQLVGAAAVCMQTQMGSLLNKSLVADLHKLGGVLESLNSEAFLVKLYSMAAEAELDMAEAKAIRYMPGARELFHLCVGFDEVPLGTHPAIVIVISVIFSSVLLQVVMLCQIVNSQVLLFLLIKVSEYITKWELVAVAKLLSDSAAYVNAQKMRMIFSSTQNMTKKLGPQDIMAWTCACNRVSWGLSPLSLFLALLFLHPILVVIDLVRPS